MMLMATGGKCSRSRFEFLSVDQNSNNLRTKGKMVEPPKCNYYVTTPGVC
uniref:Uncharacterized protein n=1 Tax=Arundo donax TaxID=35708 RepID=A0A0A9B0D8_ARUDO